MKTSRNRKLKPAAYVALGVALFVLLACVLSACQVMDDLINPTGSAVPLELAATFTPAAAGALPASSQSPAPAGSPTALPEASPAPSSALPWAGQAGPGQPPPLALVESITNDWDEIARAFQSYEQAQDNTQLGDKAWWLEHTGRFYSGEALAERKQRTEGWFSPGAVTFPVFVQGLEYALGVAECASEIECRISIQVRGDKMWLYNVHDGVWVEGSSVDPYQINLVMQYDLAAGRWKCAAFE